NGAGDTVTPTLINIVGYWFIEIPLAYLLAFRWNLQVRGVFITIPIAQLVITLISLGVFVRGGWKRRRI
ncbi:MAG: MATE family efflux transporter, partial [Acidobacteriaceae bacterium]|nr:MATE family efflux transporter [Acidobacteriaceae bacterium]